ncbi:MAG: apolipoprotein N-acyltransferase, partial [Ignavibacteriae bacterium]
TLARPWLIPAVTALGIAAWFALGTLHQHTSTPAHTSTLTVSMVQPNVDPWDKWSDTRAQVRVHKALVDSLRASGVQPDLVIWSETAIPFMIREPEFQPEEIDLRTWVDTSRIALLTGFADRMIYPVGQAPASARTSRFDPAVRFDVFNSAMVVGKSRGEDVVHHKSMLTPFAERLPFADQLTFAMSWIQWGVGISSWGKGQTRLPLPVVRRTLGASDTVTRIGTIICIESIYPEVARDMVNNGADMLCVITNDAWYNGTWGPGQHFDIARMRAIEQRRTVLRCAMSGVTGVILPDGSTLEAREPRSALAPLTQGVAVGRVATSNVRTFYASVGDVIPPVGLFLPILALITARIPAVVRKMRVRTDL